MFSYGIILCEIIARIQADPDFLPRTEVTANLPYNLVMLSSTQVNVLVSLSGKTMKESSKSS